MKASKGKIENGQLVLKDTVESDSLTSECWGIQLWGLKECEECEFLDTPDCGGTAIRKRLLNEAND